jgi:hypothetical protein
LSSSSRKKVSFGTIDLIFGDTVYRLSLFFHKMGNVLRRSASDEARAMEQERVEGQALLREMVLSSSEVDWAAVIAKANELHSREEAWLKKRNRRQRKLFRRLQERALAKRRKYDSSGSFSVNMLTFRISDDNDIDIDDHRHGKLAREKREATSVETASHDDQSYGSGLSADDGWGLTRSLEEGMEPIA